MLQSLNQQFHARTQKGLNENVARVFLARGEFRLQPTFCLQADEAITRRRLSDTSLSQLKLSSVMRGYERMPLMLNRHLKCS